MNTVTIENVNWELLREQRHVLVRLVADGSTDGTLAQEEVDALDGVLNLLYVLSERAVEAGIVTEEQAFYTVPEDLEDYADAEQE